MSIIPHSFFPRSMFDVDLWNRPVDFGPRAMDVFDPFDDLDMQLNSSVNWLTRPLSMLGQPRVPQKFRVTVDCVGFDPQSIKTDIKDDKLVVTGKEGEEAKGEDEDYTQRSFKKTFKLPPRVEPENMTSFLTSRGTLVIDIPYKTEEHALTGTMEVLPRIVDKGDGHKEVNLDMKLPDDIDPAKVHVTAKDRDIIVKAQDKHQFGDGYSQTYYYRRSTMPENTDMNGLKCELDHHQLKINAPITPGGNALQGGTRPKAIETRRVSKEK